MKHIEMKTLAYTLTKINDWGFRYVVYRGESDEETIAHGMMATEELARHEIAKLLAKEVLG